MLPAAVPRINSRTGTSSGSRDLQPCSGTPYPVPYGSGSRLSPANLRARVSPKLTLSSLRPSPSPHAFNKDAQVPNLVLVEIGPEGWTPTQQPPELSLPQLATAKGTTTTRTKKEDTET
jgi:hypothetical protein